MGQRSPSETLAAILKAFLDQRTWKQADLARHVGVLPATVRKQLEELRASGVPLENEKDHPHVFWSVPKNWFPGGVLVTREQVAELFRLLARLPRSRGRDDLIASLRTGRPLPDTVDAGEATSREEQFLSVIEDAAAEKTVLRFRYYSASRGSEDVRHASVHRLTPGPRASFLATCHRSGALKQFRVESVSEARPDPSQSFRSVSVAELDAHERASLDGFRHERAPSTEAFFVSDPDARWVARNLLEGMESVAVPGGIRVTVETSALPVLARFVVGLGSSAKPLTEGLAREVVRLATGALASAEPT